MLKHSSSHTFEVFLNLYKYFYPVQFHSCLYLAELQYVAPEDQHLRYICFILYYIKLYHHQSLFFLHGVIKRCGAKHKDNIFVTLVLINSVLTLSFLLYVLHFRFILSAVKRY